MRVCAFICVCVCVCALWRQLAEKKGQLGKRFELRVISGRVCVGCSFVPLFCTHAVPVPSPPLQVFEFEAKNEKDASDWVKNILAVLPRENIAAVKIQSRYRTFKARKAYKAMKEGKAAAPPSIAPPPVPGPPVDGPPPAAPVHSHTHPSSVCVCV